MITKSIRLSEEIIRGIEIVEKEEKIEEAMVIRKLLRIGFENYIANLYKQGKISLREASKLLGINLIKTLDIFIDKGIKGNLDITDIKYSLEKASSLKRA
jgi:predicted HTH domain antitoxin